MTPLCLLDIQMDSHQLSGFLGPTECAALPASVLLIHNGKHSQLKRREFLLLVYDCEGEKHRERERTFLSVSRIQIAFVLQKTV